MVFFLVAVITIFPGAIFDLGTNLLLVVFTAFAIFAVRIVCMLYIFYAEKENLIIDWLWLFTSFAGPIVFSLSYIYLLLGHWTDMVFSQMYFAIAGIVSCTIILISSTFLKFYTAQKNNLSLDGLIKVCFALYTLFIVLFLQTLVNNAAYLFNNYVGTLLFLELLFLVVLLFAYLIHTTKRFLQFICACSIVAVLFLGVAMLHLPYILFPTRTIFNSFTNMAASQIG